jgi:hypothetical protein
MTPVRNAAQRFGSMLGGMDEVHCGFQESDQGPICQFHKQPLTQLEMKGDANPEGLGHVTAWICPVSQKQFIHVEGM